MEEIEIKKFRLFFSQGKKWMIFVKEKNRKMQGKIAGNKMSFSKSVVLNFKNLLEKIKYTNARILNEINLKSEKAIKPKKETVNNIPHQ